MKVRSLVNKFTLKEKRKYIAKGRIYDVLHEEERSYAVNDEEGDGVILRRSECEVVEYDNPKEMDIKIGEQFMFNGMHVEVAGIDEMFIEYYILSNNELKRSTYMVALNYFKERAVSMGKIIVKDEKPKMKCEVLDSKYPHRLREAIQCFLEKSTVEEVISLSCYFDSSTDYHVAVIIYK